MCREKIKNRFLKPILGILSIFCAVYLCGISYYNYSLPDKYCVISGENLVLSSKLPINAVFGGDATSGSSLTKTSQSEISVKLKAFGVFPIKQASVSFISDNDVLLLGTPFGIKIYTDGVLVVGIDKVATEKGELSPGGNAGLKEGDIIVSINGQKVYSNEDVASIIEGCGGATLTLKIHRDGKGKTLKVKPALCYESNKFKTGIWVRDSSAGIGTLTFYSPTKKIFCGLGHGVCDVDTGELLPLNSGELVGAEILGIEKGSAGYPGELIGRFSEKFLGKLVINNNTGVYAYGESNIEMTNLIKLAFKQEVVVGEAEIFTTIDGESPKFYKCKIEKIAHNNSVTKNMVVHITDERLIQKTGGIVQGMSGSPLLQNGKLIGAVTHVLVDDPTKGYAIFAENMLETAQDVMQENLKKAS